MEDIGVRGTIKKDQEWINGVKDICIEQEKVRKKKT